MDNYKNLRISSGLMVIVGLFWTLFKNPIGPIFMVSTILIIIYSIFKSYDRTFYIIMAMILALMILVEYFFVHIENMIFYVLLLIMSLGIFMSFYFSLIQKDQITKRSKILSWIGSILILISFPSLMGIILNNFMTTLIIIVFTLIAVLISLLIRRRIANDNVLEDGNDQDYNINNIIDPKKYWFKYEIGGITKPIRWQGWAWLGFIFLSPFVVLIFDHDHDTSIFIMFTLIMVGIIISFVKSNYRESILKYRENLKK